MKQENKRIEIVTTCDEHLQFDARFHYLVRQLIEHQSRFESLLTYLHRDINAGDGYDHALKRLEIKACYVELELLWSKDHIVMLEEWFSNLFREKDMLSCEGCEIIQAKNLLAAFKTNL